MRYLPLFRAPLPGAPEELAVCNYFPPQLPLVGNGRVCEEADLKRRRRAKATYRRSTVCTVQHMVPMKAFTLEELPKGRKSFLPASLRSKTELIVAGMSFFIRQARRLHS